MFNLLYNYLVLIPTKEVEMFLAVDIGGTSVRVGAFDSLDATAHVDLDTFKVSGDYRRDFDNLWNACSLLRRGSQEIHGIGIAIAGVVDKHRTTLERAGNTKQWVGQSFVAELAHGFNCPVFLGNDAEAAAMAEAMYGNPDGDDFRFVIWGTGVGGTLVHYDDGKPVPTAGEMGHMPVGSVRRTRRRWPWQKRPRICACGQADCWEAYCGGDKILEYEGVPAEELSSKQWDKVLDYMAFGLRTIVAAHPVPRVYFGGGIAAKQAQFIPRLEAMLRDELRIVEAPSLHLSRFGESAGTVGALAMLKGSLA